MGVVTSKIHYAIMIGSGALENAWSPVYRALERLTGHKFSNPDIANLMMARLVFEPRYHRDYILTPCREVAKQRQRVQLEKSLKKLNEFKQILAEEIDNSTRKNEVRLRKKQVKQVQKYIDPSHSMIITTNWSVRELQPLGVRNYFPLHGAPDDRSSLYLPAETSVDGSHSRLASLKHGATHFEVIECMNQAPTIVVWGLGLNALDIEVTAILTEVFNKKTASKKNYKIIVFDRDPKNVSERLQLFGANKYFIIEIKV